MGNKTETTPKTLNDVPSGVARALQLAAVNQTRSIESLAELVRIPSLTGEEGKAQIHIETMLRELGAEVSVDEPDLAGMFASFPAIAQYPTHWQHDLILSYDVLPTHDALRESGLENVLNYKGRPNVVGRLHGQGGGRSLILNGHVDTVTIEPSAEWTKAPFGAEISDGRMYGRGTSDMKGGLMAALMALKYLGEAGVVLAGDIILQSVVNEEHAGNGTLDLVCRGWTADAAIVLEPTNNHVAVSHSGGLYWQVSIPGTQRSPGARWRDTIQDGISAIEKVPVIVEALLTLEREYNMAKAGDEHAGGTVAPFSLVIGKIAGGHYETVTAGEVLLKGGAYFSPHVGDVAAVMARFRQAIDEANRSDLFLTNNPARLSFLHHDDGVLQAHDIEIAREMTATLQRRGGESNLVAGPFCCDMRHLVNQGGIPAIIFGPGTIAQAHKPDEHIILAEYLAAIEHLIEFICAWCGVVEGEPKTKVAETLARTTV